jgi:DNA polymerase-3 subunit beta
MKFTAQKSALQEALTITGKCVGSASIIPIISCYKFDIDGDNLTITGGNMEVFLSKSLTVTGGSFKKAIAIPANKLATLIKELPEQDISFEISVSAAATVVIIKHKNGKYTIPCENGEDYPMLPFQDDCSFTMGSQEMFIGIDKSMFACSADTTDRFGCLNIAIEANEITFTGASGTAIGTRAFELPESQESKNVLIPARAMTTLRGVGCDELITVCIGDRSIKFVLNETSILYSMLFDGVYPDVKAVLPIDNSKVVVSDTKSILSAIKRVSNFCNPGENALTFSFSENLVKISLNNLFGESANEEIEIEYLKEPLDIKLNSQQLVKILSRIDGDKVEIRLEDFKKGVIINEIDADIAGRTNLMLTSPYLK